MLKRRHLGVKVLKALYAYHQSDNKEIKQHEKNLLQSVDMVYEMYIWMLSLISEVVHYAENDADERKHKHLPTAEDLVPQLKILENRFITSLIKNDEFLGSVKKYKLSWTFKPKLPNSLFTILKNSPEYTEYLQKTGDTIQTDKDIIKFIFKKVI